MKPKGAKYLYSLFRHHPIATNEVQRERLDAFDAWILHHAMRDVSKRAVGKAGLLCDATPIAARGEKPVDDELMKTRY